MTEAEYKKAKRNISVLTGIMAAVLLLILGVFLRFTLKKDNPGLSAAALTDRLTHSQMLVWKLDDTAYTLSGSKDAAALFSTLAETKRRPTEQERWITLHFGELYEFYIYETGLVEGFDGYAPTATKTTQWYEADAALYEQLKAHILADGVIYDDNIGFFK